MARGVEVLPCGLTNHLSVDITSMFCKSVLQGPFGFPNILFVTMTAGDTVDHIGGVAGHCCVDFYSHI